jgi:hypothetical protein
MTRAEVLAFIKTKKHAVISTCGANHAPEAALVGMKSTLLFNMKGLPPRFLALNLKS